MSKELHRITLGFKQPVVTEGSLTRHSKKGTSLIFMLPLCLAVMAYWDTQNRAFNVISITYIHIDVKKRPITSWTDHVCSFKTQKQGSKYAGSHVCLTIFRSYNSHDANFIFFYIITAAPSHQKTLTIPDLRVPDDSENCLLSHLSICV